MTLPHKGTRTQIQKEKIIPIQQDWGEAIDVAFFYGRTNELATLDRWIQTEDCRLIATCILKNISRIGIS